MKNLPVLMVALMLGALCACATSPPTTSSTDASDQADLELRRGVYWYQKGCLRKAMDHVYAAHEHYSLADRQAGVARSLNSLANIYLQTGDLENALLFYDAAVSSGRRCDDQEVVAQALSNKAAMLIDAGELSAAEVLLDEARLMSRATGSVLALILNHRAVLSLKAQRYDEAQALLDQADAAAAGDGVSAAATIRFTRGRLMTKTGQYPQAMRHFQQALELDRQAGFTRGIAGDLDAMADIHERLGEEEAALDCLDRSVKINALLANRAKVLENLDRLETLAGKTGADIRVTVHFINQWLTGAAIDAICR